MKKLKKTKKTCKMATVLLRTLTFKSKIGFGKYRDLTVQELINMNKLRDLIEMYYCLERIDFSKEVKEFLMIEYYLLIPKPGKDRDKYNHVVYDLICDINEREGNDPLKIHGMNKRDKKLNNIRQNKIERSYQSKQKNRDKIQGKYMK